MHSTLVAQKELIAFSTGFSKASTKTMNSIFKLFIGALKANLVHEIWGMNRCSPPCYLWRDSVRYLSEVFWKAPYKGCKNSGLPAILISLPFFPGSFVSYIWFNFIIEFHFNSRFVGRIRPHVPILAIH